MDAQRLNMLRNIMALEFTCVDFNLYLDTHPDDYRALAEYNATSEALAVAKKEYEALYGPLTNYGHSSSPRAWRWIEEPWPWETIF